MRIEISQLPPSEYSLNARVFWRKKYEAGLIYEKAVFYSCVDARNKAIIAGDWKPLEKARLDLTFVFPQWRRRDVDNILSRFKPGQDSIISAGLLKDDDVEHLEIGSINIVVDPERSPLTVIELTEIEGG